MADIFEEVEEGIRQDRLSQAWRKYGIFAYLAAGLLIGAVALNEYRTYSAAETTERRSASLEASLAQLENNDYQAAANSLTAINTEGGAIAPVAAHFLSQVRLEGNGDAVAAADVLSQAAGAGAGPVEKLALIKTAYLRADTMSLDELRELLSDMSTESTAFGALALELIAAKALQEGNLELARSEYNLLRVSANVPDGVQARVNHALASLPPASAPIEDVDLPDTEPVNPAEGAAGEEPTNED